MWQYNPPQNVEQKLKETVRLVHSRNTSYIYLHCFLYIKGMLVKLNHREIPGLSTTKLTFQVLEILERNRGLSRRRGNPVDCTGADNKRTQQQPSEHIHNHYS